MADFDVVVIGGGAAGAAAALAAAAAGARTALLRRGPGATALAAGAWRAAPPPPFRSALADAGLPITECAAPLPHPFGHLEQATHAPVTHARAHMSLAAPATSLTAPVTLVCGIDGLPGFHARALAALWSDAARLPAGALGAAELALPGTPAGGWSPLALAAAVERSPQTLAVQLARLAREHGAARVVIPAVLGLDEHARTHAAVEAEAGVEVGEALGTPPSLPGWRVDRALLRALAHAGIDVIVGATTGHSAAGRLVQSVRADSAGGAVELRAASFVVATGKFIGGGITAEDRYEEPAFDCDVALERFGRTFDDAGAALVLTDPVRTEPQPVLELGVLTDAELHPLRADGGICFDNLVAAGAVRAGIATAALGLGAAAQDGWRAGARAADLAGR